MLVTIIKQIDDKKENLYNLDTSSTNPEFAIKALGDVHEDGTVKDVQILSVDLVNQSSN